MVAIGTTTVRTLETFARADGTVTAGEGETALAERLTAMGYQVVSSFVPADS